jgi:hypothetical protein
MMTESEVSALFDAHDALVTACLDSILTLSEFILAYGDFPNNYALDPQKAPDDSRAVLRLFRKRLAFHLRVAGFLSALSAKDSSGQFGDAARFIPTIGLIRLRELAARYPDFEAEPSF